MDKPSLQNCKVSDIRNALIRLDARFEITGGGRHNFKIKHPLIPYPFPLPNREPINRNVVKDIVDNILITLLKKTNEEIYKELWC